ncbi:hypothetical protein FACS189475_09840 [Betaproteobacteria bacterium]|nr:hypothetical protein FACS189475_09840 [Betaproteobacteria bacterium]
MTGFRKLRMQTLLRHDINLIAYHLPLDAHPELGNNARLAALLGWRAEGRFGEQDIGWTGRLASTQTLAELERQVASQLRRAPLVIGDADRRIERLAWCSGGGQGYFEPLAISHGRPFSLVWACRSRRVRSIPTA